ncbi:hypothetical protein CMALT394_110101 [Carnobacterium maltaromaticum]|nr:hypothetical protein CMALT394_110101 [Carnobacterium maltaromaticum]
MRFNERGDLKNGHLVDRYYPIDYFSRIDCMVFLQKGQWRKSTRRI